MIGTKDSSVHLATVECGVLVQLEAKKVAGLRSICAAVKVASVNFKRDTLEESDDSWRKK